MSEKQRLLTVKDIAIGISYDNSEEGVARTIRQVRHWTQSDLLRPISQKSTGKGVPRVYEEEPTVRIAAILLELCRYGVTVDVLKYASKELYDDWDADEGMEGFYLSTTFTHISSFIQIAWKTDLQTGAFTGAQVTMFDDMELFQEGVPKEDFKGRHILREPPSSILINMTQIVKRIYPLPWH